MTQDSRHLRQVLLSQGHTLESPRDLLVILMPSPIPEQLNQNLGGEIGDPGISILKSFPGDSNV